jgi:hypothetical protein
VRRNPVGDDVRLGPRAVHQNADSEPIVGKVKDVAREALPVPTVADRSVPGIEEKAPAIAPVPLTATVELSSRPHGFLGFLAEDGCALQDCGPPRHVAGRHMVASISGGVSRGRNPLLVQKNAIWPVVTSRPAGRNVAFVNHMRLHPARHEQTLADLVTVEPPADPGADEPE